MALQDAIVLLMGMKGLISGYADLVRTLQQRELRGQELKWDSTDFQTSYLHHEFLSK